jgi:hypothetical protein
MNLLKNILQTTYRVVVPSLVFLVCTAPLWAQDTTSTSVRHHASTYQTEVRNARIVYVEGNDLVLRTEDGKVEHLTVPDSDRFTIDGKSLTVGELVPGTMLTQTITTVTTPRYVNTVRILKGKIWHVNRGRSVILTLPDGTNHLYDIPKHAKITIDGKPATAFDLKKGHLLQATIVTDEPHTVVAQSKTVIGHAPAPAIPPMVGVLLFQPFSGSVTPTLVQDSASEPVAVASAEPTSANLPATASSLPLVSLIGVLAIGVSLTLVAIRKTFLS